MARSTASPAPVLPPMTIAAQCAAELPIGSAKCVASAKLRGTKSRNVAAIATLAPRTRTYGGVCRSSTTSASLGRLGNLRPELMEG